MSKVVGLDLGTVMSVVSIVENGQPKIIVNKQGNRLTPSVVAFTSSGERLVGTPAKHQQTTNPKNTIYSAKRFMGRRHNEVRSEEKMVPYEVVGKDDELVKFKVNGKLYSPQEIGALVLSDLKATSEEYLGEKVDRAVITVPAYFNDSQRKATREAGEIAGFKVERIINEPTAAALAFGMDKKKVGKIAVFDFGGGTFDISILDIEDGIFEVLSTNGNTSLGGDDLDEVIIHYVADDFKKTEGIDLRKDPMALQRLREAAEKAKCELSVALETTISLPFITANAAGPKHLSFVLNRSTFEKISENVFEKLKNPCLVALKDAKLNPNDLQEVLLVGGSTRIPKVRDIVKEIFGKEGNCSINCDEAVASGASLQAAIISGDMKNEMVLLDVTPLSLGVETLGSIMTPLVEKNTTIPTNRKEIFSTAADNQAEVTIHVLQGERKFAKDNRTLGKFNLTDIPLSPRGVPQIEVSFDIDVNGILSVSAKDLATNKSQKIEIKGSSGLSKAEIDKMKEDAEKYKEEDENKKQIIDLKNQIDNRIYSTEKLVKDNVNVSEDDKKNIEDAVKNLKETINSDNKEEMTKGLEKFDKETSPIVSKIYAEQAKKNSENKAPKTENKDEVVDAEIVDDENYE